MKQKHEHLVLAKLLRKLAPKIGARVLIEPDWQIAGQIQYRDRAGREGAKRYFKYNSLDLNPVGASDVAKDKDYANFFMRKMGYQTVVGKTFFKPDFAQAIGSQRNIDAGYRFAKNLGFPVIVKPNSGSQGIGVFLVHNKLEIYRAMRAVFATDRVALVQQHIHGKDYRIVVLDNAVISAYERIPLSVVGDGHSSIRQLLAKKAHHFVASSRDTRIKLDDPRIATKLKHQGRSLMYIPQRGERTFLLDNANLSSGGDSIDVTKEINSDLEKIAIKLTKDMGLRLCGVDIMIEGDIREAPKKYWILEINAAPGLDHYAKTGKAQKKIVENLYLKVLKSMENRT